MSDGADLRGRDAVEPGKGTGSDDAAGEGPLSVTVLNVNDDRASRYAISRILQRAGFVVREAETGTEALALVGERPDLVVLDVHLPDVDGYEVCRRIKGDTTTASIPVLHLSAKYVREQDRVEGMRGGADGYLTQPVSPPDLLATVWSLLRLRQAERAKARAEAAAHESAERVAQLERELEMMARLARPASTVTAELMGDLPLSESHSYLFGQLVQRFEHLLDLSLEQREYRVIHPISEGLRALSDQIGFLRVGPRDVVELYGRALKAKTNGLPASRARAYVEEGRLLVLELMGYLVSYYRLRASVTGRPPHS